MGFSCEWESHLYFYGGLMHVFFHLGSLTIPAYGFMIASGVIIANIVAMFVLKKKSLDFNDFIILESYCILGAFIGAKLLYLLVSFEEIDWSNIFNLQYFNQLMLDGFVFYGGLIGGLIMVYIGGYFHKIKPKEYIINFIFLIPLIHCFGRIGCFCAGCCYGIPYKGVGAVVFPEGSFAIPNVSLFPVQIVEACLLLLIAITILAAQLVFNCNYTVEIYLVMYAITRFILEYYRYDEARGHLGILSTSQWISIVMIGAAGISFFVRKSYFFKARIS